MNEEDALEETAKQGNRQRVVSFRLAVVRRRFWRLVFGLVAFAGGEFWMREAREIGYEMEGTAQGEG